MKRQWLLILVAGLLILALAACASADAPSAPTEQSQAADEQAVETEQDESADAAANDDDGAAASQDDDTGEEETQIDAAAIYAASCARCHGADREGRNGPALLPERLTQDKSVYIRTISDGSGPMPSFSGRLSAEEIDALVEFVLSEPQ
jgi:mono/diheme cytochrome c family protein